MKLEFFEGLVIAIAHVAERRSDLRPRKPRNGCPLLCAFDCLPSCSSLLLPLVVFEYLSVSSYVGTLGSALAARGAGVGLDAASLLVSRLRKPARVKGLKGRGGWLLTSSAPPSTRKTKRTLQHSSPSPPTQAEQPEPIQPPLETRAPR